LVRDRKERGLLVRQRGWVIELELSDSRGAVLPLSPAEAWKIALERDKLSPTPIRGLDEGE
jgi:hypothetical protein